MIRVFSSFDDDSSNQHNDQRFTTTKGHDLHGVPVYKTDRDLLSRALGGIEDVGFFGS
jgi:hypothetical protein